MNLHSILKIHNLLSMVILLNSQQYLKKHLLDYSQTIKCKMLYLVCLCCSNSFYPSCFNARRSTCILNQSPHCWMLAKAQNKWQGISYWWYQELQLGSSNVLTVLSLSREQHNDLNADEIRFQLHLKSHILLNMPYSAITIHHWDVAFRSGLLTINITK